MYDKPELLDCPFCGKEPRYVTGCYVDNHGNDWPFAECDPCHVGSPVEFWNTRAAPVPPDGTVVKRWEPENTMLGYNMKPQSDGSFMLHEHYSRDVTRLQAENAALQQRLNVADQRNDELTAVLNQVWDQAGVLPGHLARLIAGVV